MTVTSKSLQFALALAYAHIFLLVSHFIISRYYYLKFVEDNNTVINIMMVVINFILLYFIASILATFREERSVIRAAQLYMAASLLLLTVFIIRILHWPVEIAGIPGLIYFAAVIYFALKMRKIMHPVLARYYKLFAVLLLAAIVVKSSTAVGLPYIQEEFGYQVSSYLSLYVDLSTFFVPIAMVIVFYKVRQLMLNREQQPETTIEYL